MTSTQALSSQSRFAVGGNRFHFISLGCPRNLVDSEVMLGILLKAGYEPCLEIEEADYIVINTCGFLKSSREESLEAISEALEGKKEGAKVIVTGCMVQHHDSEVDTHFPEVDYLLGSGDVEGILKAVQSTQKGKEVTSARSYLEAGEVPRLLSTPPHYAYLKIAEGCRKQCAYCIIPTIKGKLRSKSHEQVQREFRTLLKQGVKEVILIAQDLGDYGKDRKEREGLETLLKNLFKEEGDFWIRLLYLYPDEITDGLLELMQEDPRICPYLDMPIQHINDDMLKAMHRKTSRADIIHIIEKLRATIPHITIRTSLIVGFPGETEEQFNELEDFIRSYPLDHIGVFKYSQEEGSHAANLEQQIPEEVKEQRYERLMTIQQELVEEASRQWVGRTIEVVIDDYHPDSEYLMVGRHKGQCPDVDGFVIINDTRSIDAFGERYLVEVTDVAGYDLVGHPVKALQKKPRGLQMCN